MKVIRRLGTVQTHASEDGTTALCRRRIHGRMVEMRQGTEITCPACAAVLADRATRPST